PATTCTASPSGATSATFAYDTQANGLGKLASAVSGDGVSYFYGYDTAGRHYTTNEVVAGHNYLTTATFDSEGRPATLNYPAIGVNTTHPGMTLTYGYNGSEYRNTISYATANPTNNNPQAALGGLREINSRYADGMLGGAS